MTRAIWIVLACSLLVGSWTSLCAAQDAGGKKKVLFFSPSFGFRHSVVARPLTGELAHAEKVLKEFLTKAGYEVSVSQDLHDLKNDGAFKQYDAIIFYTTGNPMISREAFLKWLRDGGAFVGIHTATDSFHHDADYAKGWPEYIDIVGGAFKTHGKQEEVAIKVEDPKHPATTMLEDGWKIRDEIYQFDRFSRDNVHVLLSIDTSKLSDEALKNLQMKKGEDYPVAWTNTEGKGRVFYTSLGHREDVWTNPKFQEHMLGGLAWALGKDVSK